MGHNLHRYAKHNNHVELEASADLSFNGRGWPLVHFISQGLASQSK
jgi:hypothetical protein